MKFIICLMVQLILIVPWNHNAEGQDTAEEIIAQLKKDGYPTSIADLKARPIPDKDNAAFFLKDAGEQIFAIDRALAAKWPEFTLPDQEMVQEFEKLYEENIDAYIALEEASLAPKFSLEWDFDVNAEAFLGKIQNNDIRIRSVARVLGYRVDIQLAQDNRDAAAATALQLIRISDKARIPVIVGAMDVQAARSMAIHHLAKVLKAGPLKPDTHSKIAEHLQSVENAELFKYAMVTERAYGIETLKKQGAFARRSQKGYLKIFQHYIDNFDDLNYEFEHPESRNPLIATSQPAIQMLYGSTQRHLAFIRAAKVINHIYSCESEPELKSVQAWIQKNEVIDPYSGKPIIVKKSDEGWFAYSVGRNKSDDNDVISNHEPDFGFGPIEFERN